MSSFDTASDDLALSCKANASTREFLPNTNTSVYRNSNLSATGAILFENTAPIRGVRASAPRFGLSSNITQAITGSSEQAQDYIIGLTAAAIAMFIFFVLWCVVLLVFKFLGYEVVGFFSGSSGIIPSKQRPKVSPEPSSSKSNNREATDVLVDEELDLSDDDSSLYLERSERLERSEQQQDIGYSSEEWDKHVRKIRNIRIFVIFSGLVIIAMAVLMVAFGIQSLNRSVGATQEGLEQGSNLANAAVEIIDTYLARQNTTLVAAQTVLDLYSDESVLCDQAKEILCDNVDCDSIFNEVPSILDKKDELVGQLLDTRGDLIKMEEMFEEINHTISRYDWAFWVAAGAVLLLAVCTLVLLNGVIMAWHERLNGTCWGRTSKCLRGWLVVPIFVVLLIVCFVFSMVFVIGSIATADFCYNSPDANVLALLYDNKDRFDGPILFPTLVYYVSGCPENSLFEQMGEELSGTALSYLTQAREALAVLTPLSGFVDNICGASDNSDALPAALSVLSDQTCAIYDSFIDITDYSSCENFNGLYATVAYEAVCYNGNSGFVWIASTQFVILVFAMIMLTLRVAFYELVPNESESGSCLSKCSRGRTEEEEEDS